MHRKIVPKQMSRFEAIARQVKKTYPKKFDTTPAAPPRAVILPPGSIATFLGLNPNLDRETILSVQRSIGAIIRPDSPDRTKGVCTRVAFVGSTLGIVVESEVLSTNIRQAHAALGDIAGRDFIADQRPFIPLGENLQPKDEALSDHLEGLAIEACGERLPWDRVVILGSIAYKFS